MTDKQPEALRLADALNRAVQHEAPDDDVICVARWFVKDSADELRRLQALNAELLEALKTIMGDSDHGQSMTLAERCYLARAAIAKGEQP